MTDDLRYGWAPGNYMATCCTCATTHTGADKRSLRCRPCAEKLAAKAGETLRETSIDEIPS